VCYLLVRDGKTLRHLGSALSILAIGTTGIKHSYEELSLKATEVLKEHTVVNLKHHPYLPKEGWNSLGRC